MSKAFKQKILHFGLAALMTVPLTACSGDGSDTVLPGQVKDYTYPDPAPRGGTLLSDIFRVRISNSALDFLAKHIGDIVASFMPAKNITVNDASVKMYCINLNASGASGDLCLPADELSKSVAISFASNSDSRFPVRLNIALNNVKLYASNLIINDCDVNGKNGGPVVTVDKLNIALDIGVKAKSTTTKELNFQINGDNTKIEFGFGAVSIHSESCGWINVVGGVGDVLLAMVDIAFGSFTTEIVKLLNEKAITEIPEVPVEFIYGLNIPQMVGEIAQNESFPGMWMYPTTFGLHVAPNLDPLRITQNGNQDNTSGLSIVLDAAFGAEQSNCVADLTPPVYPALQATLPDYTGQVNIYNADGSIHPEKYDAVVTLSQATLAQFFYSVVRSGALCLRFSTEDIAGLAGGAISPTAGLFATFAPELSYNAPSNAPVIIQLKPTTTPDIQMGTGNQVTDENGKVSIDSLVSVGLNKLELSFYLLTENRFARMFTIMLDVNVGLSLVPMPDTSLAINVDKLDIGHFETAFSDLAPHADLGALLQSIMDMTVGSLLSDTIKTNVNITKILSETLHTDDIKLYFNAIRREPVEEKEGETGHYLTIYATMCDNKSSNDQTNLACWRAAHSGKLPSESASARVAADSKLLKNLAEPQSIYGFDLAGETTGKLLLIAQPEYEYSYKVDNGPWYSYRRPNAAGKLLIENGVLAMQGRHNIQLKARVPGRLEDEVLPALTVNVDTVRPAVFAKIVDENLHVWAADIGSEVENLQVKIRTVHNGEAAEWQPLEQLSVLAAAAVANSASIEVVASDEAGNVSPVLVLGPEELNYTVKLSRPQTVTNEEAAEKSGCNAGNGAASSTVILFLLAAMMLLGKNFKRHE